MSLGKTKVDRDAVTSCSDETIESFISRVPFGRLRESFQSSKKEKFPFLFLVFSLVEKND